MVMRHLFHTTTRLYVIVNTLGWLGAALSHLWTNPERFSVVFRLVLIGLLLTWNVDYIRRHRNHLVKARLMEVAELNHVVRNSLQVIVYQMHVVKGCDCGPCSGCTQVVLENVEKIDAILKHLFPAVDHRKIAREKLHELVTRRP